jgi:hypothetical protein
MDAGIGTRREYPFHVTIAADASTSQRGGGVCWRSVKKDKECGKKYGNGGNYFKLYSGIRNFANSKLFLPFELQNAEEVLLSFERELRNAKVEFLLDKDAVSYPRLIKELINLALTIEGRQRCKIKFRLVPKNGHKALLAANMLSRNDGLGAKELMANFTNSPFRI